MQRLARVISLSAVVLLLQSCDQADVYVEAPPVPALAKTVDSKCGKALELPLVANTSLIDGVLSVTLPSGLAFDKPDGRWQVIEARATEHGPTTNRAPGYEISCFCSTREDGQPFGNCQVEQPTPSTAQCISQGCVDCEMIIATN